MGSRRPVEGSLRLSCSGVMSKGRGTFEVIVDSVTKNGD
jgi:hypothetical protein